MSWLTDYCKDAARTDQLSQRPHHVALLAAGLFGEAGSVLAELKKTERETGAYPSYLNRLTEEIGDLLWYFARLVTVSASSEVRNLDDALQEAPRPNAHDAMSEALALGAAAGSLLTVVQQKTDDIGASQLDAIWRALLRVACSVGIDLRDAAQLNLEKSSVSGSWRENPRKGVQVRRACADT